MAKIIQLKPERDRCRWIVHLQPGDEDVTIVLPQRAVVGAVVEVRRVRNSDFMIPGWDLTERAYG